MKRLKIVGKALIISMIGCMILYFVVVLISNFWIHPATDVWTKPECLELVKARVLIWFIIILLYGFIISYRIQSISLFKSLKFGFLFFVSCSLLVWLLNYFGRWGVWESESYPPAYDYILLNYMMPVICAGYFTRSFLKLKEYGKIKDENERLNQ